MPTLRSKSSYVNLDCHQGRAGLVGGNLAGIKPRKRKRRSSQIEGPTVSKPDNPVVPAWTDETPSPRMTRNKPVRCLDYGSHRKTVYPLHKMCSHCNDWETQCKPGMGRRSSGESRRNVCQENHTSHIFPTALKTTPLLSKQLPRK